MSPRCLILFWARMSASAGRMVIRPIRQKLAYHIGIITRGIEVMNRGTRQLADSLISKFEADPIIITSGQP